GGTGNDTIFQKSDDNGVSHVFGGQGDDSISNFQGVGSITGGTGNDTINDISGVFQIFGNQGNDSMQADELTGTVYGGTGSDTVSVADGNYVIYGGHQDDRIVVGLDRHSGTDTAHPSSVGFVYGGQGNDTIETHSDNGGFGVITETGGTGNEQFIFDMGGEGGTHPPRDGIGTARAEGNIHELSSR